MQLLTSSSDISVDNRIFVATSSSSDINTVCILVLNLTKNTINELNFNNNNDDNNINLDHDVKGNNSHHTKQLLQQQKNEINYIYCSNDGKYIFASLVNKYLYCWEYIKNEDRYDFKSSTVLKKRPTSLVHTVIDGYGLDSKKDILFVSDKAGDVWSLDIPYFTKQVLVSGHCASVITDMDIYQIENPQIISSINTTENVTSLVATADRDEKIRITCFPNMVTIMSYCLGHTNVVTSIAFFNIKEKLFLISGGWDHSYIIWDPLTGTLLDKISNVDDKQIKQIEEKKTDIIKEDIKIEDMDQIDNNNNEEEDDDENKQYNEDNAGNYPLKIRVTTSSSPLIAIIFRRLSTIKIYSILDDGKFGQTLDINLPYVPVDVTFLNGQEHKKSSIYDNSNKVYLGHIAILLQHPEYLQVYEIYKEDGQLNFISSNSFPSLIQSFKDNCNSRNLIFEQVTGFGDENSGMNRDALNKPFRKEIIDISNRKHNKRSANNKRKLEEIEEHV